MAQTEQGGILIYGSTGYTGRLVVADALQAGLPVEIAGRSAGKIAAQSGQVGVPGHAAALDDPDALDRALLGKAVVIHCAGPFARTWRPMAEACLRNGVHYMDITGEIEVLEGLKSMGGVFADAGLMALPGAGFDVVPTDFVAGTLAGALPDAVRLELAFHTRGTRASHGTATSVLSRLGTGGAVRRDGRLRRVPTAWRTRRVDFGEGPRTCMTIPWGDLSTAHHTTSIPDITVYIAAKPRMISLMKASNLLNPVLRTSAVRGMLQKRVDAMPAGPSERQRMDGRSLIWGRVENGSGDWAEARLETMEGYRLTAATAVALAGDVLAGRVAAGYQTPFRAYPELLAEMFPQVRVERSAKSGR